MSANFLSKLGVYGYGPVEPVILAGLVSGDPLLLVGKAGTGKTFLLNSLSEALDLEHRHYNASLIAFDDLVGFPWPEEGGGSIKYIQTPATIWQAESVLIDEINRCKPEHQNRLFSLVHERRIQGLKLERLQYRWAAMNPPGFEGNGDGYAGCEPLDAALADRFAFIIRVADWHELSEDDRKAIADPRGDGKISRDTCGLLDHLGTAREKFAKLLVEPPEVTLEYARRVADILSEANVRLSPRRVRQLTRNLLALDAVSTWPRERLYRLGLESSLPQFADPTQPDQTVIDAAHRSAWELCSAEGEERWLHQFHCETDLPKKVSILLDTCLCPETGALAISQFLASANEVDRAIFAFSLFPALSAYPGRIVTDEGLHDLGKVTTPMLSVNQVLKWRDPKVSPLQQSPGLVDAQFPAYAEVVQVLKELKGRRKARATQLLCHLMVTLRTAAGADKVESTFHRCFLRAQRYYHGSRSA